MELYRHLVGSIEIHPTLIFWAMTHSNVHFLAAMTSSLIVGMRAML
jgi:hypothetical protein